MKEELRKATENVCVRWLHGDYNPPLGKDDAMHARLLDAMERELGQTPLNEKDLAEATAYFKELEAMWRP